MARYLMEVLSRALEGRDAEYAAWYLDTHIGEVCELDGIDSGQLHHRLDAEGKPTGEFVAHYMVETDDPAGLLQRLFAAAATMKLTDTIDMASTRFSFLTPVKA